MKNKFRGINKDDALSHIAKDWDSPTKRAEWTNFAKLVEQHQIEQNRRKHREILFESFLRENSKDGIEFRLVVSAVRPEAVEFYCHPINRDGTTFDGYATKFTINPKIPFDNLLNGLLDR